jgi:hypothetical protein
MVYTLTRNYEGYGGGLLSPDCRRFYVNISKNASSYMADILSRQGWSAAVHGRDHCAWHEVTELVIVLRDPVDRWCSGVAQYLMTRILNSVGYQSHLDAEAEYRVEDMPLSASAFLIAYNTIIERFIFDNLDLLDDHVWAQHEFFQHIMPRVPRRYIIVDHKFEQNLQAAGIQTFADADRNSSDSNMDQSMLKHYFQRKLESRADLMRLVRTTYARDYELIDNA